MTTAPGWIGTPHIEPDLRGPVERALTPFPDPAAAPPIIDLLRAAAEARPEQTAFEDDRGALSFDAFWKAVCRLAAAIECEPATGPIAILLPTGNLYAVALFACLAARRVTLLLDEHYPAKRNTAIATSAGISLLLSGSDMAGIARLDPAGIGAGAEAPPLAAPALDLEVPAFILATSGSTGEPKLIAHSQRTMLHWVRTLHHAMHVTPDDRVLSVSSPSSLGGITSLLTFPLCGAASQMFEIKQSGLAGLLETLTARPVTILRAAPSLLRSLCQLADLAGPAMARLRIVQTYGEPLLKSDVEAFRAVLPRTCLIRTTYGSTEASGLSWYAGAPDAHDPVRVATGALMPDTRALIVDETGRPCPAGEAGELLIASRYNALGEWSGGRLAAGPFESDPADPQVRIFRTGDIARCSADGIFVVLGRKDRMAKINGQRVEPAEVEAALRRLPGIRRAEVALEDQGGKTRLIAFLIADDAAAADAARVRAQLADMLPPFMIPSRIFFVHSIPLLPGGKVDSAALLALARTR
jgi:acyl-coenzyme A synthetase/AMP-(fatty) acid ligase